MHRRIRDVGNTWRHRLSRGIANRARLLVLEKLNTQGMTSSGKGTVEQPGVNVRAKAGLNRSILATGWAELEQMLSYQDPRGATARLEAFPSGTSTTREIAADALMASNA